MREDVLRTAVAELVAERAEGVGSCPEAEELVAYRRGELPPDDERRIRDHLLICPDDTALLLDLERLESGELGAERRVSEFELAAAWKTTRARLVSGGDTTPGLAGSPTPAEIRATPRPASASVHPGSGRFGWLHAAAAVLLLAAAGLSTWVHSLRQTVADLSRPQLDVQVVDLFPGNLRAEETAVEVLALAPEERSFTLILHPVWEAEPENETFDLEVVTAGGEPVWSGRGMRPHASGSLSVSFARKTIGPGDYRLRLYRSGEPRTEPAVEFPLRVVARGGGGAG